MAEPTTIAGFLQVAPLVGLPSSGFVPASLQAQCATVAQRNIPAGLISPSDKSRFVLECTAQLIARGLIYAKATWGDCGNPNTVNVTPSASAQQIDQTAIGIASMAGSVLPGIGPFVKAITGIFGAAHAQAVAKEQETICGVVNIINQAIPYYDRQVKAGNISPAAAVAGMQTFFSQVNEQLQTIEQKCNAACWTQGFLKAHADFMTSYYPAIAPVGLFSGAPGGATTGLLGIPGGVLQIGEALITAPLKAIGITASSQTLIGLVVLILAILIGYSLVKT